MQMDNMQKKNSPCRSIAIRNVSYRFEQSKWMVIMIIVLFRLWILAFRVTRCTYTSPRTLLPTTAIIKQHKFTYIYLLQWSCAESSSCSNDRKSISTNKLDYNVPIRIQFFEGTSFLLFFRR